MPGAGTTDESNMRYSKMFYGGELCGNVTAFGEGKTVWEELAVAFFEALFWKSPGGSEEDTISSR
jgi:hypothetical protein